MNSLALAAAEAVLDDADYLAKGLAVNREGMKQLEMGLRDLGLPFVESAGNFILMDCGQDALPLYQAFLREGIILRPVGVYELPTFLRVSIGLPDAALLVVLAKVTGTNSESPGLLKRGKPVLTTMGSATFMGASPEPN